MSVDVWDMYVRVRSMDVASLPDADQNAQLFAYRLLDSGVVWVAMHAVYQGLNCAVFNNAQHSPFRILLHVNGKLQRTCLRSGTSTYTCHTNYVKMQACVVVLAGIFCARAALSRSAQDMCIAEDGTRPIYCLQHTRTLNMDARAAYSPALLVLG